RSLEEVLLRSIQDSFNLFRDLISEAVETRDTLQQELDSEEPPQNEGRSQDQIKSELAEAEDDIEYWSQQQDDLLNLIAALAGSGGGSDPENCIDSESIAKIAVARMARQASPGSAAAPDAEADTKSSADRKVIELRRHRGRGRPPTYRWPEFSAEMAR